MSSLTMQQAIQDAQAAGFTGSSVQIIAAIAMAESSLNPSAQHTNTDGSIDRGILQINNKWHPEVSNSCAYDVACSFQQGLRISSNGTNFSAWSTYNSGAYQQYLTSGSNPQYTLATSNGIPNPLAPVTDVLSGVQQILSIVQLFSLQNIRAALFKTGLFIVAALFIVVGFIIIANKPDGGSIDLSDINSALGKATKATKSSTSDASGAEGAGALESGGAMEVPIE